MEYMDGGDLQQYLEKRNFKPVPTAVARSIVHQLCEALKYLHSHHIIHKDIKLENVMLQSSATSIQAKLADFGLSEIVQGTQDASGAKTGTEGYLAPEILAGKAYDTSSDIWSLGCLLFAMLTISLPFPNLAPESGSPSHKKNKQRGFFSMG